jgi:hypothetical protein
MKNTFLPRAEHSEGMSVIWTAGSRIVLLFTALIVLLMPWTEYFWHFDKFLQGGQDLELGLLSIATLFCLVLVLLQHGQHSVRLSLSMRRWASIVFQHPKITVPGSFRGLITALHVIAVPSPALGHYTLPLQV